MNKYRKQELVAELSDELSKTPYFYIVDSSNMTVAEINKFRRKCFEKNVKYRVFKNTIICRALKKFNNLDSDIDFSTFSEKVLKGFSGILFSNESPNTPARILEIYKKQAPQNPKPLLKGAFIESEYFIGAEYLETLSNLKSKKELVSDVISLLSSPTKNILLALKSSENTLSKLLEALSERRSK